MQQDIHEIISETIDQTILKLKMAGLMKDEQKSAFQRTEQVLKNYKELEKAHSEDGTASAFIDVVDRALKQIEDDDYFDIIPMIYFDGWSREEIAEFFGITVTTVSRNKTRLVNKLKTYIFADDVIKELFL